MSPIAETTIHPPASVLHSGEASVPRHAVFADPALHILIHSDSTALCPDYNPAFAVRDDPFAGIRNRGGSVLFEGWDTKAWSAYIADVPGYVRDIAIGTDQGYRVSALTSPDMAGQGVDRFGLFTELISSDQLPQDAVNNAGQRVYHQEIAEGVVVQHSVPFAVPANGREMMLAMNRGERIPEPVFSGIATSDRVPEAERRLPAGIIATTDGELIASVTGLMSGKGFNVRLFRHGVARQDAVHGALSIIEVFNGCLTTDRSHPWGIAMANDGAVFATRKNWHWGLTHTGLSSGMPTD